MVFLLILIFITIFLFIFHISTKKFVNPFKLTMVFGKKGSGKSTLLTKMALKDLKSGKWQVYTTENIPGTYQISDKDIGVYQFPEYSSIYIDEVGLKWDNRNFKNFKDYENYFFKYQRHNKLKVTIFSQTFDVDLKIRNLTDEMYLCKKIFRVFTISRLIDKNMVINKSTAEAPSNIAEDYEFVSPLLPNAVKFTFIPYYSRFYNSFERNELPLKKWKKVPAKQFPTLKDNILKILHLTADDISSVEAEISSETIDTSTRSVEVIAEQEHSKTGQIDV